MKQNRKDGPTREVPSDRGAATRHEDYLRHFATNGKDIGLG